MMKMMILAPRRAGMTHSQFRWYVVNVHGPLVKSIPEVAADIRHYHYNFPVSGASDRAFGHPAANLDIITQGFFDSRDAQLLNMQHPRFKTVLRPDESKFADTKKALMHYTDEHEIIPGEKTAFKLFYLRRREFGLMREDFQALWKKEFPVILEALPLRKAITRYVQNHVQAQHLHPDGEDARYYDVIDEFCLQSPEAFAQLSPVVSNDLLRVETELLARERTKSFVATMVANIP
jgi:hypothetical protein